MPPRPSRTNVPVALLAALLVLAGTACGRPAAGACAGDDVLLRREGILTLGADLDHPPFAVEDPDEELPSGFEIDLLRAVAERLGLELRIEPRTQGALVPELLAHRIDLAASGLRDTELPADLCASAQYLDADLGVAVPEPNPLGIRGPGDLDGRSVGVAEATVGEEWARRELGRVSSIRRYPAPDDLLTGLASGEVDAAIGDLAALRYHQRTNTDVRVVRVIDLGASYVSAAAPDNAALIRLVDDALRSLHADGTLPDLRDKWFTSGS